MVVLIEDHLLNVYAITLVAGETLWGLGAGFVANKHQVEIPIIHLHRTFDLI